MTRAYQVFAKFFGVPMSEIEIGQVAELGSGFATDVPYGNEKSPLLRTQRFRVVCHIL